MNKIKIAEECLLSLNEIINETNPTSITRDALFHRFKLSVECAWKAGQQHLRDFEQIEIWSAKEGIETCTEIGIMSNEESQQLFQILHDRKYTSLTYHPSIASDILGRIPSHYAIMHRWIEKLKTKQKEGVPKHSVWQPSLSPERSI